MSFFKEVFGSETKGRLKTLQQLGWTFKMTAYNYVATYDGQQRRYDATGESVLGTISKVESIQFRIEKEKGVSKCEKCETMKQLLISNEND